MTAVIIVVAVVLIVVAAVWWFVTTRRRRELQDRFGREYQRAVDHAGSTRDAERELAARTARHDQLQIRDLTPERRANATQQWRQTQARFVDEPKGALGDADQLVQDVMSHRGYPTGDFDQRAADLSVEHADVLDRYRQAHDIARAAAVDRATTEDLRQGLVHYRALFVALVGDDDGDVDGDDGGEVDGEVDVRDRAVETEEPAHRDVTEGR